MDNSEVEKYSKLIYSIASSFPYYKNKNDLYQAGYLGLLEASKNYDNSFDTKFSTYAYSYILGQMKKLVREDRILKVSKDTYYLVKKIEEAKDILTQKYMRVPTKEELSSFLEIDILKIEEACASLNPIFSLDDVVSDTTLQLEEVISNKEVDILSLVSLKEELQNLEECEKLLFLERYIKDKTQSEVAKQFKKSQVSISRMEDKMKQKIKNQVA